MMIVTRLMEESDISAVAELESSHQPRPWTEEVLRSELTAENRTYLVSEAEDVVGFGGVMVVGDEAHITNLLVARSHRRQGIATEMLVRLIDAARDGGARHLTLEVRSENDGARLLYSRFGLVPVGVRPGYYGDDDALILWAHDIDGDAYARRIDRLRVGQGTRQPDRSAGAPK